MRAATSALMLVALATGVGAYTDADREAALKVVDERVAVPSPDISSVPLMQTVA